MRISTKARYAVASLTYMVRFFSSGSYVTLSLISKEQGISKIYLEQIFAMLKKARLVKSEKGSKGGYLLALNPGKITVLDILNAVEQSVFINAKEGYLSHRSIEQAIDEVLTGFNESIKSYFNSYTLDKLASMVEDKNAAGVMYHI